MHTRSLSLILAAAFGGASTAGEVETIYEAKAGPNLAVVRDHVERLAQLAQTHIAEVGIEQAMADFYEKPWRREANGLHLWGVTREGISWYDAGHPELQQLDVSEMTDIEGRNWSRLAWHSASGEGAATFMIVFPHPTTSTAARGLHNCFMLADGERALCAGAFEDPA